MKRRAGKGHGRGREARSRHADQTTALVPGHRSEQESPKVPVGQACPPGWAASCPLRAPCCPESLLLMPVCPPMPPLTFPCSRVSGPLPPALALLSWPIPSPSSINSSPEAASPSTQSREDQVGSELYHAENFPSSLPLFFIFTFFCFLPTYGMGDLSSVTKNQTRDPCNGSAVS